MGTRVTHPIACTAIAGLAWLALARTVCGQSYFFEAEAGVRTGVNVANAVSGYRGTGYVTGFDNDNDRVSVQANVPAGLYELWIGFRSQFGEKGYYYQVNGESGTGMFPASTTFAVDRVGSFALTGGTSTLSLSKYWGYHDVDYFELRPYTPPALLPVPPTLVDSQADAHAQALMTYLTSIYGEKTLSGQQHESSSNQSFPVQSYLNKSGGIVPAIRATDLMEYSPTRIQNGANPRNESEQTIAWAKQSGGIVTMSWHWNAPANLVNSSEYPWYRGFYTQGTTFDLPGALSDPASNGHQLLLRDIDAIAVELQKFENAGVPVIWRPLHEAQGGWFWWGAHGPDNFKQLWNLTYDRLTNHHGLHNLIWEFTSSAAEGNHLDWYPGDDVVDMIGLDVYTDASSSMSGEWSNILEHYNGRKLIALSETGTLPNPELMDLWGIEWSYFSPWSGEFVDRMSPAQLQAVLNHEDVITLTELPVLPWSDAVPDTGDFNSDGTVDGTDFLVWQQQISLRGVQSADGNNDGVVDAADLAILRLGFSELSSIAVPEPVSELLCIMAILSASAYRRSSPSM
jgi:mannan endo-1,4-beta-mannosidase